MAFWRKEQKKDEYDREQILEAGDKAEKKGDRARAIEEYQKILRWEPQNNVLHLKVAVLLSESRRETDAWTHFLAAGEGYARDGFLDKAAAVYTQASSYLPSKGELWLTLVDLNIRRGRKADALKVCLEGRPRFRKLAQHQQAAQLLRKAIEIEPFHLGATLDLARLQRRVGHRDEARRLLHGVAVRNRGRALALVRGAQLRLSPTPAAAWRWLRAAVTGR